jgi:mannose-6-phosphate isomerase-like protein (cupin superfamily)
MTDELDQIAARVRDVREIAGISITTLAKEFDIPANVIEAYESGNGDIPVSYLYKIAQRFHVEMTTLLTGKEPHLHIYSLVRKGEGVPVERSRRYKHLSLGFHYIHKKMQPFLVTVEPSAEGQTSAFNSHPGEEFQYILNGRLKVILDDHELILNEGDSLLFNSAHQHSLVALDGKPVQFLAVIL